VYELELYTLECVFHTHAVCIGVCIAAIFVYHDTHKSGTSESAVHIRYTAIFELWIHTIVYECNCCVFEYTIAMCMHGLLSNVVHTCGFFCTQCSQI
jgi:hypothetical protein